MMKTKRVKKKIDPVLKKKIENARGISLDIGCGWNKKKGFVGLDMFPFEGVDIVHDINSFPWPIPDNSCSLIVAANVLHHVHKGGLPPQLHSLAELLVKKKLISKRELNSAVGETQIFSFLVRFMDEAWRIMKEGGQLAISVPYAGSVGFYQDPTSTSPITEAVFLYFDPSHQSNLWSVYRPKPWKIDMNTYQVNGNIEVILSKINENEKK